MPESKVFISYSHEDEKWKDRLLTHLRPLVYEGLFDPWDDSRIRSGEDWEQKINDAIDSAVVAVLLVSAHSLGSDYILKKELPRLLERRKKWELSILPVILKPCVWNEVKWLAPMQVRPKDGRPVSKGSEAEVDADLAAIAGEIADIFKRSATDQQQPMQQSTNRPTNQSYTPPMPITPTQVANFQPPLIHHNLLRNGIYFMDIQVPGFLHHSVGRYAQIVVRFFFQNNVPLFANPMEMQYRDTHGNVVTGTSQFLVTTGPYDLSQAYLSIPYYAFNLRPTGGQMSYYLVAFAEIFVNNALIARTPSAPFTVVW
jgi:hypothetical protein